MSAVVEIVEKIEKLTLLEAAELKKALEEKFGVTAAAPMMMAAMPAAAAPAAEGEGGALPPAATAPLISTANHSVPLPVRLISLPERSL